MPNRIVETAQRIPPGIEEVWTQVAGLRVRYWRAGTGTPIVLLHGLLGYCFNWRRVVPALAEHNAVYIPDMPGSGVSECSPTMDCGLTSAAKRLIGFLDAVGIESCDLIGSSYGGATAISAAALNPARVKRLILVSPANPWSRFGRKRLMLLRIPLVAAFFPIVARSARPTYGYFLRRMYGDPRRITAETRSSHFRPLGRSGVLEHGVEIVKTWRADMRELEAILPRIARTPTLLLWGSKDRTVDPASATPLSRYFECVQVEMIEGAGHLPYEECPEEFCRVVADFLAGVSSQPAELHGK